MAIGTRESSFLPIFLLLTAASAVVVPAAFVCPGRDENRMLERCNSTVECPVYQGPSMVYVTRWASFAAADCRIVFTSRATTWFISNAFSNLTLAGACSTWFTAAQRTSSSAATLLNSCSSSRYSARSFFFTGDVVLTFVAGTPVADRTSHLFSYEEVELRPLCSAVMNINSSSFFVPPLDFAGGGNCVSRLESPPGTAMKLTLRDSQPRAGGDGGLSSGCVCYSAAGVMAATSGCLAFAYDPPETYIPTGSADDVSGGASRGGIGGTSVNVGSVVTLTVKGDSAGLLCSAVIYVNVSWPGQLTSMGKASRTCSCRLLLLLLLLCEAARLWRVPT